MRFVHPGREGPKGLFFFAEDSPVAVTGVDLSIVRQGEDPPGQGLDDELKIVG